MFTSPTGGDDVGEEVIDLAISIREDKRFRYQLVGTIEEIEIDLNNKYRNMYNLTIEELQVMAMKSYKNRNLIAIKDKLQELEEEKVSLQSILYDLACWDI